MDYLILTEEQIIDKEIGGTYQFISKNVADLHTHDFFEIFLITKGSVIHYINGQEQLLQEGSLVFIRPSDIHTYGKHKKMDYQFINLTFSQKTMEALDVYLGEGFNTDALFNSKLPPFVVLSEYDKKLLGVKLNELNIVNWNDKRQLKIKLRGLLVEIFSNYFLGIKNETRTTLPCWLEHLLHEIQKPENFRQGITVMQTISDKSREHICRAFKKYLNASPSEYVNRLRMNYAINLLTFTDMDIMSICLECGFQSLSHFYHIFKHQFGMAPADFRKQNVKH